MVDSLTVKRDKIVGIVKTDGPLLPVVIAKRLDLNITFAAAMLSELVANNFILITNVKFGGSPFYYLKGQEEKLKDLMKHLNGKDRDTAQLLMEKKILKDRDLMPLQRVSLRQIKDYAKQITVRSDGKEDIFWKWYLTDDEEAKKLITIDMENRAPKIEKIEIPKVEEVIKIEKKEITKIEKKEPKKIELPKIEEEIIEEAEEEVEEEIEEVELTDFVQEIDPLGAFLIKNKFEVIKQDIIKKDKEINFITELDIKVGKMTFFVKYKDKKRVNESDLSLALHEAGKLPLFFISTGELSKKAEEMMNKEFKGMIFRKL